jgi:hypothetical protein
MGLSHLAQNKSHTENATRIFIEFSTNQYNVETHRQKSVGFFLFYVAF